MFTSSGTRTACAVLVLYAPPAAAQIDLAGEWAARSRHEDEVHRIPGPELGDYAGFPVNDAGRLKAETWDASILSQPEQQARPHAAQYSMRGPFPNFRMGTIINPRTDELVAYTVTNLFGNADRTIWMDGRPHPSPYAEHTWDGFSTGEWVGTALKVTTTHMKAGFLHRNGVAASARSTMTEFLFRHDLHLVLVSIIDDPVYLDEPLVRTSNFVWAPTQTIPPLIPFEIVDELAGMPQGWVPSYPMGTHHTEFARRHGLPFEASQGGAATMYPEYAARMRQLTGGAAPQVTPPTRVPPRADDVSSNDVEVLKVQGNVYMVVAGDTNVAAQVGDEGVFLVDTGSQAMAEKLLAVIRTLSSKPIRYVANTSADLDHVGGNGPVSVAGLNLAAMNATGNFGIPSAAAPIVAHEQVLNRMSAPTGAQSPFPFAAWPSSTFVGRKKTLSLNGEGIELLFQPAAHSDGDTMVYFRGSDVISTGDVFRSTSYPVIDRAKGGSIQGTIDALNRIIDITIPRFNQQGGTRVIPGHGRLCNESDVVEYRDMVTIVRDRIQLMASQGMTVDQVKGARPTLDYDGVYSAGGDARRDAFIEAIYEDVR